MQRRVFVDSDGVQHGIHDVVYDLESNAYSLPNGTPVSLETQPTSFQQKFADDVPDFIPGTEVDGTPDDTTYSTIQHVDGRPSGSRPEAGTDQPSSQPSTSRYATGNSVPSLIQQRFDEALENNAMVMGRHTATALTDQDDAPLEDDQDDQLEVKISEPLSAYNAQYPYNQVKETESGHVMEMDDTPGAERVNITHRTGTFIEMHPNGKRVDKTLNDRHDYTTGDSIERVEGNTYKIFDKSVTIKTTEGEVTFQLEKGSMNITLNEGNVNIHLVGGNLNMKVDGNVNEQITGNVTRKIGGNLTEQVTGDVTRTTSGSTTDNTTGDYTVKGATINLN